MKMSSGKQSAQDKRELEKFTRFLAIKAAEIIVQSRSGKKIVTKCKPNSSGADWFNLSIQDSQDVLIDAKQALCKELFNSSNQFCVEILLKTVEDDIMVLETWSLNILPEFSDPSIRVTYTIYNRMGMLLKSLLSVSRITPAYKLSRNQCPDSYSISYRIYMEPPQLHSLGDNYKHVKVGQLCTPIGTIHLSVSYRTKMTISPTQTGSDSIKLKSDHFHSDLSPKHIQCQPNEFSSKLFTTASKIAAFSDIKPVTTKNENNDIDVPFGCLLEPSQILLPKIPNIQPAADKCIALVDGQKCLIIKDNTKQQCYPKNGLRQIGCLKNSSDEDFTTDMKIPFVLSKTCSDSALSNHESQSVSQLRNSLNNLNLDSKIPSLISRTSLDLSSFYCEFRRAPQLQDFDISDSEQTMADHVGDLNKELETFEISMHHYKDLINSFCKSGNSS